MDIEDVIERLFELSAPWWEFVIRAVAVYMVVLVMLRVVGKRTIGQYTPFDLVVVVLLGTAVQNSLIGDDISLIGGLLLAGTLLGLNWLVGMASARWRRFDEIVEGRPVLLAKDGEVFRERLREQAISDEDFAIAMRKADCREQQEVHVAMLETSGEITILKRR